MESNYSARPHVTDLVSGMSGFQWIDYCIFIAMLTMSAGIGVYFGYKEKQKNKSGTRRRDSIEQDYLVGGRKLNIFPVAMSLTASWISGVAILGMTSEVYVYGTQFCFFLVAILIGTVAVHYIFIPVFHDLKITSSFEYLEARFDRKLRSLSAIIFIVKTLIFMPVVFYATALAFNQLTGISIYLVAPITGSICIFYTCFGGMKAVIWTDVIQTVLMFGTLASVVIKGTLELGFGTIWEHNVASGRIEIPEMTVDLTVRHSMISVVIGAMFLWIQSISINQMCTQRYVSLPTVNAARKTLWIFIFSVMLLLGMCYYCGLVAYAKYHDCDPIITKLARSKDQILAVLITDLYKNIPGFSGLFVTGIFSAALSSLSTALNSLAAVVLEDFFKQFCKERPSIRMTMFIMQGTVLIAGACCVGLVFVVEKLGSMLQLSFSIGGSAAGPMLAIYVMGLLIPRINHRSAFIGGCCGFIFMIYIAIRAQLDQASGKLKFPVKPVAAFNCQYDFDTNYHGISNATTSIPEEEVPGQLHHVSYMLYTVIGFTITLIISTFVSFFVKHDPNEVRPELLAPFIRKSYKYKRPDKQHEFVHHFNNNK